MARVLALSSQVARGHVGLSAIVPALQRLGHEAWAVPTVVLSNHVGHPHVGGTRIEPDTMLRLVDALDQNGWLAEIDAIITGYLPSPEHVKIAAGLIKRIKSARSRALYLCDPVLGDNPKGLYIDQDAAIAISDELIELADIVTPNLFELGWLSGAVTQTMPELVAAARKLGNRSVVVTSAAARGGALANILIAPAGSAICEVAERSDVPHGTGDLFAALLLGHLLNGENEPVALGRAAAGVERAIMASVGRDELALVASQAEWADAPPLVVRPL